jgi:hypothetical protein
LNENKILFLLLLSCALSINKTRQKYKETFIKKWLWSYLCLQYATLQGDDHDKHLNSFYEENKILWTWNLFFSSHLFHHQKNKSSPYDFNEIMQIILFSFGNRNTIWMSISLLSFPLFFYSLLNFLCFLLFSLLKF